MSLKRIHDGDETPDEVLRTRRCRHRRLVCFAWAAAISACFCSRNRVIDGSGCGAPDPALLLETAAKTLERVEQLEQGPALAFGFALVFGWPLSLLEVFGFADAGRLGLGLHHDVARRGDDEPSDR